MRQRDIFVIAAVLLLLAACSPGEPETAFSDLPEGDAARGEMLFSQSINEAPACNTCHRVDGVTIVGPPLDGFGETGAERVEGQSAAEYAYFSIVRPSRHVVRGYSNVMFSDYESKLSAQDIADLIAYLTRL